MTITLATLLGNCGFVPDMKRTKLVRHSGPQVESLQERWLETYQQYQSAPVFGVGAAVSERSSLSVRGFILQRRPVVLVLRQQLRVDPATTRRRVSASPLTP